MSTRDVVCVGGGVIGLAIAWRARSAGLSVAVVDDAPGRGASWAAAGLLAPVTELHAGERELLSLSLDSNERYPAFVAELEAASGRSVGYRSCGTLVVACDADENVALDDLYALQREHGLDSERLAGRECRALEPALSPRVRGGIHVPGDHQVETRALVAALLAAGERTGVEVVDDRARRVLVQEGRAAGVELEGGGELHARSVVLCAGCWSGGLEGVPEGTAPVRPVKGQTVHLRTQPGASVAARSVRGAGVYVVPRVDGRVVVGATVEEQGFDTRATAGAVLVLLRGAYELFPGLMEAELTEIAVGLRPGSPDNAPVLGPTELPGLIVAAGHYRNGILLTPVTADTIAELLVSGEVPEVIAPFGPARFASARVTA